MLFTVMLNEDIRADIRPTRVNDLEKCNCHLSNTLKLLRTPTTLLISEVQSTSPRFMFPPHRLWGWPLMHNSTTSWKECGLGSDPECDASLQVSVNEATPRVPSFLKALCSRPKSATPMVM